MEGPSPGRARVTLMLPHGKRNVNKLWKSWCVVPNISWTQEAIAWYQGMLIIILKGEGSATGLTSCPNRTYLLRISFISEWTVSFHFQNKQVPTSRDQKSPVHDNSPLELRWVFPSGTQYIWRQTNELNKDHVMSNNISSLRIVGEVCDILKMSVLYLISNPSIEKLSSTARNILKILNTSQLLVSSFHYFFAKTLKPSALNCKL